MGKTPLGKPAQVQNFNPDVTEVRPVVRFRRFCHRAPHREQTADGHTAIRPFTVITPQWLQETISQGRFYMLKIPKKSPSKEVYLLKMLCFFLHQSSPLWFSGGKTQKQHQQAADDGVLQVHSQAASFTHCLWLWKLKKNMLFLHYLFKKKTKNFYDNC